MKFTLTILLVLISCAVFAQVPYETSKDPKHPEVTIYKGVINKYLLQNNEEFNKWYTFNQKGYTPDSAVLNIFLKAKDSIQFVLFGGTWCDDSQFILPRFFKMQEMAGLPDSMISFFGVDRQKQAIGNIASAFAIINVPTIIVMKNGKEIGRVVEYGKTGKWEKELAEIITSN
ncbi:thioredoxin family protein [Ferruginibacter lapsinanis]|uniref:thioredoxin family protein n=1 Tax=Ferruginibacter lapsinanis TaxID=563172 RepID=UPI001E4459E5|nr:thioredoxin family protein [Ferruginibacter lapsinanis]UEG50969.1 thioredoxin family protein [Ferruginibacter lapsinanis]